MQTVRLNLKERSYNIITGKNILSSLGRAIRKLNIGKSAYIITNRVIKHKHGNDLSKALADSKIDFAYRLIPDSEGSKSMQVAFRLVSDLAAFDKNKRIFVVTFGGGVVGDVGGFLASIYKRGVPYVQVPTTLLAQVDSAIGGKTAVDLMQGKNLVGAFYQPRLVYSDVHLLKTLSIRQLRCGLAEVIKYGVIRDKLLFDYLEKNHSKILKADEQALEFIVAKASYIKARIVEKDERETKGLRTILNFGHTIGHAIEAACAYKGYHHGEAVGLGMIVAAKLSRKLKLMHESDYKRLENLILALGLPAKIKGLSLERVIRAHYRDKKFIGLKNRFVLSAGIGKAKIVENIRLSLIKEAIVSTMA